MLATSLLASLAVAQALAAPVAAPDQTDDARLVLQFLEAVKRGDDGKAQRMLRHGAFVGDYAQVRRTTFAQFAAYARECKLSAVRLVPSGTGMPIGITWQCAFPASDRAASFWVNCQRIARIGWGALPAIQVTPMPKTR